MDWTVDYVGMPFVPGGRGHHGCDCWGLVRLVYRERLGIELPSYAEIDAAALRAIAREVGGARDKDPWRVVEGEPRPFDVAVMRVANGSLPSHVGVMVDVRRLLHVEEATSACIVPVGHPLIRHRIITYRRHRDA